jgi:phosphoribosylanthranilate isomerase
MTWIKICGITNLEDALAAASLGIQALGFVFAPSPRRIDPPKAREIILHLPPSIQTVGVFVDAQMEEVYRVARRCGLGAVQLHGHEPPEYCHALAIPVIKAFRIRDEESFKAIGEYGSIPILLDAWSKERAGGTGKTFSWEIARRAIPSGAYILSGGLTPENVGEAIGLLHPAGVDVSSGVEKCPGRKDFRQMKAFVQAVRRADGVSP